MLIRMLDCMVVHALVSSAVSEPIEKKVPKQQQQPKAKTEKHPEDKMSSKVKKFFGFFFE